MRLPEKFRCDWPGCDSEDTAKVTIMYDGEPKVHADICEPHAEPLKGFMDVLPASPPSRAARSLEQFIVDRRPGEE